MLSRITVALTLPPTLSCGPSPRRHVRRVGPRLSKITARHLPGREPGLPPAPVVPSLWAGARNFTPDLRSAHIAACAERHTHHCAPARNSASRANRCDGLHLPCRDFISMVTSLPRCRIVRSPGRRDVSRLQQGNVLTDWAFFEQRQWYDVKTCIQKCTMELDSKLTKTRGDLWKAIRAYNGSGPKAQRYMENVRYFTPICAEVVGEPDVDISHAIAAVSTTMAASLPIGAAAAKMPDVTP
jgi:hypothetical protein